MKIAVIPLVGLLSLAAPTTPAAEPQRPNIVFILADDLGYGDAKPFNVMQTDSVVGEVLDALERNRIAGNTLVFFASDNGCSPVANFKTLLAHGHHSSALLRGAKADIWDGGHRIPFLARWPGVIKPGTRSDQLICLGDLMATCADLLDVKLPPNAGEDSISFLPVLAGKGPGARTSIVHHSIKGKFSVREGNWKLEFCPGSGGWSDPKDGAAANKGLPEVQLYDLSSDIGEQKNVQDRHPDIVKKLTDLLKQMIANGRSTPGPEQKNDVAVAYTNQGPS